MSTTPTVSPNRSPSPSSNPATPNSTHSTQQAPQTPTPPFASDTTTSYSFSLDTASIWDTLRSIKQWFSDQFDAIISCLCSRTNSEHIEQSHLPEEIQQLPEEIQQLIAPLKDWLEDADCPATAIKFDQIKFDQTLIDFDALENAEHPNHQGIIDGFKACTEPTYFLVQHHDKPKPVPCIIIPFEIKADSASDYKPDFLAFNIYFSQSGEPNAWVWICLNSEWDGIAQIQEDGSANERRLWLAPLLRTGTAHDQHNDIRCRLKQRAAEQT
jgi:hypothetical protein